MPMVLTDAEVAAQVVEKREWLQHEMCEISGRWLVGGWGAPIENPWLGPVGSNPCVVKAANTLHEVTSADRYCQHKP